MKLFKTLTSILLYLAVASICAAQGVEVHEIRFQDDQGKDISIDVPEDLKTKVGAPLSAKDLAMDQKFLDWNFPQFLAKSVFVDPLDESGQKVAVVFEFQRKRTIRYVRIMMEGPDSDELFPTELRDQLKSYKGSQFSARNLESDKKMLTQFFILKGYPKAHVETSLNEVHAGRSVDIQFRVSLETRRILINEIDFKGNEAFKDSELAKLLRTRTRSWFLASYPAFKLFSLDEDMETLQQHYQDQGYLNAQASYAYKIKNERYIEIDISIDEGQRQMIEALNFEGQERMTALELEQVMGIKGGTYYSDKKVRKGLQKIREALGEKGYPFSETNALLNAQDDILYVKIKENNQYYINEVKVEGALKMKPRIVLRDVHMSKGDLLNTKKIEETLKTLKETGYYSDVKIDLEPVSSHEANLLVTVKEAATRQIRFGAGMGMRSGIFGQLSYEDKNFFHTGKRLSLNIQKSLEMSRVGLIFQDPHLMGSDYEMSSSFSYTRRNKDDFDEDKLRAIVMVEKEIKRNLTLGVGARVEFLSIENISEALSQEDHVIDGKGSVVGLVSTLRYSTLEEDSAGDFKEGVRINVTMMPSYSDQEMYLRSFSSFLGAVNLGENQNGVSHSLKGRITLGYASERTPFYEKFYAGGPGSVRGFERESISVDDSALGGGALISMGGEYSFPVWGKSMKGVLFVEGASLGNNLDDMSDFRVVGGMGAKFNLRQTFLGTMLEAGVAIPIEKQEADKTKPFYFIFGDYDPAYDL